MTRRFRPVAAGLAIVLAWSIAVSGSGNAWAGGAPIPWIDVPATSAMVAARTPKPLPNPAAIANAPACHWHNLVLQPVSPLQWSQNGGVALAFKNVGSHACLLRETPRVSALASGGAIAIATTMKLTAALGEVANTPAGESVHLAISIPLLCSQNPGGSTQGLPTYNTLVLKMPGGITRTIRGVHLQFPCGMSVSPFLMPAPPTRYPAFWPGRLIPHLELPKTVTSGSVLSYLVSLVNPLARTIALSPCPLYLEHTSTLTKLEYLLNCRPASSIAPHATVTFAMKLAVPPSTRGYSLTIWWVIVGFGSAMARASVEVLASTMTPSELARSIANVAACKLVVATQSSIVATPPVRRLAHRLVVDNFHFRPPSVGFTPRVAGGTIWFERRVTLIEESAASYEIYLARYFTPPGQPELGGIPNQEVWVLVGRNLAFRPDPPPLPQDTTHLHLPACVFGSGFVMESASSGKVLAG